MTKLARKAITKKVKREETVKDALYLTRCDSCSRLYKAEGGVASLQFGKAPGDCSNFDSFYVCSLKCFHRLLKGGWRKCETGRPFAEAGAFIARVRDFTPPWNVRGKKAAIREWEEQGESAGTGFFTLTGHTTVSLGGGPVVAFDGRKNTGG